MLGHPLSMGWTSWMTFCVHFAVICNCNSSSTLCRKMVIRPRCKNGDRIIAIARWSLSLQSLIILWNKEVSNYLFICTFVSIASQSGMSCCSTAIRELQSNKGKIECHLKAPASCRPAQGVSLPVGPTHIPLLRSRAHGKCCPFDYKSPEVTNHRYIACPTSIQISSWT